MPPLKDPPLKGCGDLSFRDPRDPRDHPNRAGLDQSRSAGRRSAMVTTRLKGDIGSCTLGRAFNLIQRLGFSVRATGQLMISLTNDPSMLHQYTTDSGVWVSGVAALIRQNKRSSEKGGEWAHGAGWMSDPQSGLETAGSWSELARDDVRLVGVLARLRAAGLQGPALTNWSLVEAAFA